MNMYMIRNVAQRKLADSNLNFLMLLEFTIPFMFSDERDKVYGLLALHERKTGCTTLSDSIRPNYAAGKLEAYRQVAEYILIEERLSRLILVIHHADGRSDDCLSWTPYCQVRS
jgi:hypothetical protein